MARAPPTGTRKPLSGRQQGQHQTQPGAGEVVRAEIDVQGQRRESRAGPPRCGSAAGRTRPCVANPARPRPSRLRGPSRQAGPSAGQRRQQGLGQAVAHALLPLRQPAPGRRHRRRRRRADCSASRRWLAQVPSGAGWQLSQRALRHSRPAPARSSERKAGLSSAKGKKAAPTSWTIAGQGRAAANTDAPPGRSLRLQHQHAPAVPGQRRRRRQAVGPRADHHGVEHESDLSRAGACADLGAWGV